MVIATKYNTNYKGGDSSIKQKTHYTGVDVKLVHASPRKPRTLCIDILYVHWWDYTSSIEEVMNDLSLVSTTLELESRIYLPINL